MRTNEQAVVSAKERIAELKAEYMDALSAYITYDDEAEDKKRERFLTCQQKGTALFNFIENFVGDSDLLGAHRNGRWVTGLAEDCSSHLDSIVSHFDFLRSRVAKYPEIAENIEPCETAYANMQRMVVEYLPQEISKKLRKKFSDNNLPVMGFDVTAADSALPRWQIFTSLALGAMFVIASATMAIMIPKMTDTQEFVLRGMLAVGMAAMTPIIPGFVKLTSKIGGRGAYFTIVAGGSIAIFVMIWLLNPPKL